MAIQKLGDTVVRTIGASQVLTDPAALVKELLDNALDAHATSIAIEIHNNTLDIIQVRDNGHGIAPDDRSMVAMPNCTSKLVDINDLKDLGGVSLGFRGQALASAAELSGSLTISTRVEGEQVATALKISQSGEVVGQERASLPVGTTVRITDFIKSSPVRRQVALKNNEKCLKKIKQTLQAYAFARPHVRLSLRVLKAKNDKGNWMYAPKPGGNVEDAAMKIVGSACVSQCTWSVIEEQGFTLQAFLPRSDAEPSKVSSIGAFISIDARPVSAARGTLRQVVKIFRDSLKAANTAFDGVKEPFIYMRIACPSASYDPNIEPAKDDVLFEDPDVVVAAARQLFAGVYPVKEAASARAADDSATQTQQLSRPRPTHDDEDDFVTSLELPKNSVLHQPRQAHEETTDMGQLCTPLPTSDAIGVGMNDEPLARPQRIFRSNMYGCDEEDLEFLDARPPAGHTEADFEELRQARKDVSVSNPWVVAKMNATIRRPVTSQGDCDVPELRTMSEAIAPVSPFRPHQHVNALEEGSPPTPRASSPSPLAHNFHPSDHVPDMRLARDGRVIGSQALPRPQLHMSPALAHRNDFVQSLPEHQPRRQLPSYDYTLGSQAVEPPAGTPLHAIPGASQRPRRSPQEQLTHAQLNRPFVSPVVDQPPRDKVWFDHLEEEGRPRKQKWPYQRRGLDGLVHQGELGDLIDDPRPMTPPRRNRDIRDYVGSVDLTGTESAASLIEGRHYGKASRSRSVGGATLQPCEAGDENSSPTKGMLSSRGFIPASELAAMEARFGPLNKATAEPPPKPRKTGESRALREVSGNATAPVESGDSEEEYRPMTGNRAASRRRRTTEGSTGKVHRTKSSRLPLERIPVGKGMHDITVTMSTSSRDISRSAGKVDDERSLLGWNEPALDAYDAFAAVPDAAELQYLGASLRELLISRVSDGEMVQDVVVLLRDAFAAPAREQADTDAMVE
ncbi:hypothetical protein LTR36_003224 [Oleoguttula mirabilis]|uniref:DNA mismatch repair protein S5 domain-containing protein n=1 Tax=Oleoguttula mirabilis TaxID=1507867 RepID=A0AAV9JXH4_9PEZI|nr:hypothetical protein LTR36_003224 [Oleoguttula mirabilis]